MSELLRQVDAYHVVFAGVMVMLMVIGLRRYTLSDRISVDVEKLLGVVGECHVELLVSRSWRRYVGLVTYDDEGGRLRCCISGRDARRLAEMLRIAALPGRNLAHARFRRRRAHRVS